ncbi:MAG: site-specific DNA-methyltransferase [archaeon YNP-LCB-003-016]|uniref:DNA-methyltransferase n=1 Tax=Candidatus Culexarchaeum yellowstonense TaxID=2928963 RepID=UPI0026F159AF|nr:site-specific DNA-methyltransferase [Candidatus Culexarchaeum yellowstonense]MCR6693020.1 site-specific DNA-methyltransferase [Candidatus Culexarchaeum yellowstonense]
MSVSVERKLGVPEDKVFYRTPDGSVIVINDDFLKVDYIKPNSIDLVVTSPPYNVDIEYEGYRDNIPYEKYLEFTEKWLRRVYEILKPDGRICLNIPLDKSRGRTGEGFQSVYVDVVSIAKRVGFEYFSTIIWNESNISRRTAWGSFASASAPYVIAPVEVIVLLYKHSWKRFEGGDSDITPEEFKEWTLGLWTFQGENPKRVGHPAPFPLELPKRCIKLFSYVGDVVLDPFVGSGTTLVAAYLLRRKAIGIDISRKYCEIARERLIKEAMVNVKRLL